MLSGYSWVLDNCDSAAVIGKVDDDVIFNVQRIESYFSAKNVTADDLFVTGPKNMGLEVVRDPKSKWYLSEEVYPHELFPQYAAGFAYFVSTSFAEKLVETLAGLDLILGIDDAYLTGIMAVELNATRDFDEIGPWKTFAIGCGAVSGFLRKLSEQTLPGDFDLAGGSAQEKVIHPVNHFPLAVECQKKSLVRTMHTTLSEYLLPNDGDGNELEVSTE